MHIGELKPCKHCGSLSHYSFQCYVMRKPIRRQGKVNLKWIDFKRRWKKTHKPDKNGLYYCYLCGKALKPEEITLDHIIPRSRRPDLRFDETNIAVACWKCNTKKGSRVYV